MRTVITQICIGYVKSGNFELTLVIRYRKLTLLTSCQKLTLITRCQNISNLVPTPVVLKKA